MQTYKKLRYEVTSGQLNESVEADNPWEAIKKAIEKKEGDFFITGTITVQNIEYQTISPIHYKEKYHKPDLETKQEKVLHSSNNFKTEQVNKKLGLGLKKKNSFYYKRNSKHPYYDR